MVLLKLPECASQTMTLQCSFCTWLRHLFSGRCTHFVITLDSLSALTRYGCAGKPLRASEAAGDASVAQGACPCR